MTIYYSSSCNIYCYSICFFIDKFFITITILSLLVTEVSATYFEYLHVLGFKLQSFSQLGKFLDSH